VRDFDGSMANISAARPLWSGPTDHSQPVGTLEQNRLRFPNLADKVINCMSENRTGQKVCRWL